MKASLEHPLLTRGEREGKDVSHGDGRIRHKATCGAAAHLENFMMKYSWAPPPGLSGAFWLPGASGLVRMYSTDLRPWALESDVTTMDERNSHLPFLRGPETDSLARPRHRRRCSRTQRARIAGSSVRCGPGALRAPHTCWSPCPRDGP